MSGFSSFMREYLDPVGRADHCIQNVDDIGILANIATSKTRNFRAVLSMSKVETDRKEMTP